MQQPKEAQLKVTKSIFQYLKGIDKLNLFPSKKSKLHLLGFTNAYWIGA
jgi:hypothetical protein